MNAVVKEWVDALRSGKYQQTKYFLHRVDGGYCCLGVLCDLYANKHKDSHWVAPETVGEIQHQAMPFVIGDKDRSSDFPYEDVLDWANLPYGFAKTLAYMNDRDDSFNTIADKIEGVMSESQYSSRT